ncbi:FMN-dependent NADH-azoreductase [Aquimarina sp. 2201CG14-23]|uniref:FMN-dependent NADH-azoreductase n=1 Tax=Aquimarina mycalae TaxID=3040073 RepID=UPI00247804A5|nr:NAD(P)H-dependent oxidoreductase [Aquimarina sp. 2201CG14-23]MDH7447961.1 NAD(P)H-dependent oxidoreductase [Aquimarina sp. 2201CG14-23]
MKLLRIDASSRTEGSDSRMVADQFQQQWLRSNPNGEVIIRDLIKTPIPHINQQTIEGFYTPPENFTEELADATSLSDQLISELKNTNILLISTPMYNFGVPSALKAWIDHIVRINVTFGVTEENAFFGKIQDTKAYIITTAGAVYTSEEMKALDFLQPYLQTVLGLIGITDVTFLSLQGTTMDTNFFEKSKAKAVSIIRTI